MTKIAIVGYGNIGKAVYEAAGAAADMEVVCIVSSQTDITAAPVVASIDELKDVDVAVLCGPSRAVPAMAEKLLAKGICTVDSFDIHSDIADVRRKLDAVAKEAGTKAIMSAGWDPGSDSVVRALCLAMAPKGLTYTNFGPGMSMGHTVAVKAIDGVNEALSMTIPIGTGLHRRMVYIELAEGADYDTVAATIKADPYFVHDETHVIAVPSVDALQNVGHGVNLVRNGVSGTTGNQRIEFNMAINNPGLTGQILISSARAVTKQAPGCYTMIQVAPIDYLEGDTDDLVRELV